MARQTPSLEIKPSQGGKLMAGMSSEAAGLGNYIVKRDWRRVIDREIRAEGCDGLALNPMIDSRIQTYPGDGSDPLTVLAQARRGDGKRTIVAGNKTTLWAYTGTEDTRYVIGPGSAIPPGATWSGFPSDPLHLQLTVGTFYSFVLGNSYALGTYSGGTSGAWTSVLEASGTFTTTQADYYLFGPRATVCTALILATSTLGVVGSSDYFLNDDTTPYVDETQNGWIQIAGGLSALGRRWEAVQVGDYLVLNNGVDLPLTYHPGDQSAFPIYELREQQIASVGTIAAHDGNLLCMDLWQINDADFAMLMAPTRGAYQVSRDAFGQLLTSNGNPADPKTLFPNGLPDQSLAAPGLTLFFSSGQSAIISHVYGVSVGGITSNATGGLIDDGTQIVPLNTIYLESTAAYGAFTDKSLMQRFPWRLIPSMPGQPRRFGATVPVGAALYDRQLIFKYPIRSLSELAMRNQVGGSIASTVGGSTDIVITYAGFGGSSMTVGVTGIRPGIAMSCFIAHPVLNPIVSSGNQVSNIEASDAFNSYAGTFADLVDDGGAIIKALQLRDQMVIYKETPAIFLGTFTGDAVTPYTFQRIAVANKGQTLCYRNTVVAAGGGFYGSAHIYAGRNGFYKFDLFTQTPQELPELQAAQDVFFAAAPADPENAFVAENPLTREWVWGWTGSGSDRALCYDYAYKSCRTTSAPIRCASRVQHPIRQDWLFLYGDDVGGVQRYGLFDAPIESPTVRASVTASGTPNYVTVSSSGFFFTVDHIGKTLMFPSGDMVSVTSWISATSVTAFGATPNTSGSVGFTVLPGIWHRNTAGYDSTLESGLGDMGAADNEKLVTRYVLIAASQSQNSTVNVQFKTANNPSSPAFVQSTSISAPVAGHNLIQPTFMGYYVGNRVTVSGYNNPFELSGQLWKVQGVNSASAGRL